MIRFAFNPNESARKRMAALRDGGMSDAFSALFKPKSVGRAEDERHKLFVHEQEILELLEVIDGSKEDEDLLGFLDYDKINKDLCIRTRNRQFVISRSSVTGKVDKFVHCKYNYNNSKRIYYNN